MSIAVQRRRGTTANHTTFTGLEGEITVDTTKETTVVHDGATAGGFPLAREDLNNVTLDTLAVKGLAKEDLTNVSLENLSAKGLAKDDMSNVSQESVAGLGIAKSDLSNVTADASETAKGMVELATIEEAKTGTDTTRAITPASLKNTIKTTVTYPFNYINGLRMSNASDSAHDITIHPGACIDISNTTNIRLSSPITKKIDANWSAGTNAGGFPSASTLGSNRTYHVFLIYNPVTDTVDAGFDANIAATNLRANATGYTKYRRIGSIVTNGSNNIRNFNQKGGYFYWKAAVTDVSISNIGPNPRTLALTVPGSVNVLANFTYYTFETGTSVQLYFWSPITLNQTTSSIHGRSFCSDASGDNSTGAGQVELITNTSRQIRVRGQSISQQKLYISTTGWYDFRDQI